MADPSIRETYGDRLGHGVRTVGGYMLAVGPLMKQPGTVAYRRVLQAIGTHQMVVTSQFFPNYDKPTTTGGWQKSTSDSYFGGGHYFKGDELDLAMKKFAELVKFDADNWVESLTRPLVEEV